MVYNSQGGTSHEKLRGQNIIRARSTRNFLQLAPLFQFAPAPVWEEEAGGLAPLNKIWAPAKGGVEVLR